MTQITHSTQEIESKPAADIGASIDAAPALAQPHTQDASVVRAALPSMPKKKAATVTRVEASAPAKTVSDWPLPAKDVKAKEKVAANSETPVSRAAKRKIAVRPSSKTAPKSAKAGAVVVKQVALTAKKIAKKVSGKSTVEEKPKRAKKEKVVRDGFTMPKSDYDLIAVLKLKCMTEGVAIKKGELLRAGLRLLNAASSASLLKAVKSLETVKTGRPRKT